MAFMLGMAIYESVKVSNWLNIAGGLAILAMLVWIASWGPISE